MQGSGQARRREDSAPAETAIVIAGRRFLGDPSGALVCPDERLLVVADLHLEKGSSYARRRVLLPPYDTAATLARLARVIAVHDPRRVIALGDSFHDRDGAGRLDAHDAAALRDLQRGRDWLWVAGNHDPLPPAGCGGEATSEVDLGGVVLRHEPGAVAGPAVGEIAGHLHPVALVQGTTGSVRRRCFVADAKRCVLPAFGAFAGGLNWRDAAFAPLFGRGVTAFVLGRDRVHAVPEHRCRPDRVPYDWNWRGL